MSDEPLPPPPDVLAYGEFTLSLRSVLNGKWVVRIAHQARDMVKPAINEARRDPRPYRWGDQIITGWRDGVASGEFDANAKIAGPCIRASMIRFCHPAIIAQCHDMPLPTLEQEIEFVLAAVRTR